MPGNQGIKQSSHNGHPVTSEFIGVSWSESRGEWRMDIGKMVDGFRCKLHSYHGPGVDGELAAAIEYNRKAIELYGPGARLN